LNKKESAQWPQFTRAIPRGTAGMAGLGAKLIILLPGFKNRNNVVMSKQLRSQ